MGANGARAQSDLAGKNGNWMVEIKTPSVGGSFSLAIELKNAMSGEVWYSGGPPNMDMPLLGYGAGHPASPFQTDCRTLISTGKVF